MSERYKVQTLKGYLNVKHLSLLKLLYNFSPNVCMGSILVPFNLVGIGWGGRSGDLVILREVELLMSLIITVHIHLGLQGLHNPLHVLKVQRCVSRRNLRYTHFTEEESEAQIF